MDKVTGVEKKRRRFCHSSQLAQLNRQLCQLQQIELRMDDLFQQIVDDLDEEELWYSSKRFDELVSAVPELRLSNLDQYPDETSALLAHLDPEQGPLPGFDRAMERLCLLCLTPHEIYGLRSSLYSVAAHCAECCRDLLPTVAIASLTLTSTGQTQNTFVDMVVCASAIEWVLLSDSTGDDSPSLDVSTWLIAEPSSVLVDAVGWDRAHYYASIPGILAFLDFYRVLFEGKKLGPHVQTWCRPQDGAVLSTLVDESYLDVLGCELKRVQAALCWLYSDEDIADVYGLADRALESLDELPADVNPLLRAILVQSWVQYVRGSC